MKHVLQKRRTGSHEKRRRGRSLCAVLLSLWLICLSGSPTFAEASVVTDGAPTPNCQSALLMEASTGTVLMEKNADQPLPPASVTKIMTLLLVMEAIEQGQMRYEDRITVSAHASSMGGSQIFLKEGEQMSAEDLIKSVVIASANDAAVALAEHLCGSEEAFVERMNRRARELGMSNSHFENTNGLDDTAQNHVCSAKDIALMSRALLKHKKITEFSSIWMDTIRDGAFGLTNTNRLIRFYSGATGLKTGSTAKAGFCISATAERDGMTLICVIMGAPSRDVRNGAATALLDYGFANYSLYSRSGGAVEPIEVPNGVTSRCTASYSSFAAVVPKGAEGRVEWVEEIPASASAPIASGQVLGRISYRLDGREIGESAVVSNEAVSPISYLDILGNLAKCLVGFH